MLHQERNFLELIMIHTLQKPWKAIMRRSQLETKYLKTKTQTDLKLKKNRNFCSKLYKRERRKYYESLDRKNVLNSKKFWNTIGLFLSDKNTVFSQISIEKNSRIISDNFNLSEEFSTFFEDAVRSLNLEPDEYYVCDMGNLSNPVELAIRKFENHPGVQAIKHNIDVSDILKETTVLNNKKNGTLVTFVMYILDDFITRMGRRCK